MADPFEGVDWNVDLSDDDQPLAEALWWEFPPEPFGPGDDVDPECPGPPS